MLPKQPVLDWIKRVDSNPPNVTLEQIRLEQNAFLVPDTLDGQQDAEKWVQKRWQVFFESFLDEWYTVESWWPAEAHIQDVQGLVRGSVSFDGVGHGRERANRL
ncbi:hypothetical protein LP419_03910 [Massilia sp. H-1]|nr:hypothetical protein LP419_03910 [Massilia sp. H-1]